MPYPAAVWKTTGEKHCTKCSESRPISQFYMSKQGYPSAVCKPCTNKNMISPRNEWKLTGTKKCPSCKEVKALENYSIVKSGIRKGHPVGACKVCRTAVHKARVRKDPTIYERIEWPSKLKKLYGITPETYYKLLEQQNGCCAICGTNNPWNKTYKKIKKSKFSVDHCHTTGKVRGLLCTKCNRALGLVNDNIETVFRMAGYLKQFIS
jgi:Recombination endonuclease VII